jgi:hypothetical protein
MSDEEVQTAEIRELAPAKPPRRRNGRCAGTTTEGKPCPAAATTGTYCYWHNPEIPEAEKNAARSRGQRAAQQARLPLEFTKADYSSEEGARKVLEEASDLVRQGKLPVSVANALAKLAGVALKASELRLAAQINALEARLREQAQGEGVRRRRRA